MTDRLPVAWAKGMDTRSVYRMDVARRWEQARRLREHTSMTLQEIGYAVGLSVRSVSRALRKD